MYKDSVAAPISATGIITLRGAKKLSKPNILLAPLTGIEPVQLCFRGKRTTLVL